MIYGTGVAPEGGNSKPCNPPWRMRSSA